MVLEDPTIGEPGMEVFAGDMSCGIPCTNHDGQTSERLHREYVLL